MRWALAALLLMVAPLALAEPLEELKLLSEHVVDNMAGGNLSGLAVCGDGLWTESDRDDNLIFRLNPTTDRIWKAEPLRFEVPRVPPSGLAWGLRVRVWAAAFIRGGDLDFEGITCDGQGNRYLVSEGHAGVLQVPVKGPARWLDIDPQMVRQARAHGLLQHFNAIFEGLAINPAGDRLWLAAERENRGLIALKREQDHWVCDGPCVLMSEGGDYPLPAQLKTGRPMSHDFADLSLYHGKLFTMERNGYQICRRDPHSAAVEHCWSFAEEALQPGRRYNQPYGLVEALVIDDNGAWLGIDNNDGPRVDGEKRPIVWRFAAPAAGWDAAP